MLKLIQKIIILSNINYIIYTDGACLGNPGPGGWAAIIFNKENDDRINKVGSEAITTNNRMELMAVIEALKSIPSNNKILVFTDSKYVINGIEAWIIKWKKNNWLGSKKTEVKNKDLWMLLDELSNNFEIKWNWVKGHSGDRFNEEVDRLARDEASRA